MHGRKESWVTFRLFWVVMYILIDLPDTTVAIGVDNYKIISDNLQNIKLRNTEVSLLGLRNFRSKKNK